jgi:ATP-dependent DNA ligase
MLAMLADAPLSDPNLVYGPKYDGIRALVAVAPRGGGGAHVRISSRAGNDKTVQLPEVALALSRWGETLGGDALLDASWSRWTPTDSRADFSASRTAST